VKSADEALALARKIDKAKGVELAGIMGYEGHIIFTFDEAMQSAQSIAWSANLAPANFAYSWSTDQKRLTCKYSGNLPANVSITWKLNPSSGALLFKDPAGNILSVLDEG